MADSLVQFETFSSRFNQNENPTMRSEEDIQRLEDLLEIKLPEDFRNFIFHYGDLWTPQILDIIVDEDSEMHDIQQFWPVAEIIEDKRNGYTNQIEEDLIAFASDCMGNIYVFKTSDLKKSCSSATVYFFDLDFNQIEVAANSFTELIEQFNSLI